MNTLREAIIEIRALRAVVAVLAADAAERDPTFRARVISHVRHEASQLSPAEGDEMRQAAADFIDSPPA